MNENKKRGIYLILAGAVLFAVSMVFMYANRDAVPSETATSTATTTELAATTTDIFAMEPIVPEAKVSTEGWKTCRNEEYGYEFKFPAEWHIYGEDALGEPKGGKWGYVRESSECNGPDAFVTTGQAELGVAEGWSGTDSAVRVSIQDVTNNPKVSKNLEELYLLVKTSNLSYSLYTVDGEQALFRVISSPRNQFPNEEWSVSVFIDNLYYHIKLHSLSKDPERAVLETILSTFRFLNKESTSTEAEAQ